MSKEILESYMEKLEKKIEGYKKSVDELETYMRALKLLSEKSQ